MQIEPIKDVPGAAKEARSALEALEAQLRQLDEAMAQGKLAKAIEKATDPLKKQQLQLKLSVAQQRSASAEVLKSAAAQDAMAKAAEKADRATAKASAKAERAASKAAGKANRKGDKPPAQVGMFAGLSGDNFEKLGGVIEDRFGKRTFRAFSRMARGWKEQGDAEHKTADTLKLVTAGAELGAGAFIALAGAALTVVAAVAGLGLEGIKFAGEMAVFKQNTQFAMKYALGSGQAAADAMGQATQIAAKLGASVTDIAPEIQKLMGKGLGSGEAGMLAQVMADMKAASGGRVDGAGLAEAVKSLKNNQGMTADMLAPLRDIGPGAQAKVFESLAKSLNITTTNATTRQQQVLAQIGRLRGQKGMDAFSRAMLAATGKDKAGGVQKEFADTTLQGSYEKVKNQLTNLFAKIESGKAGSVIVGVFNKMAAALDPTTAKGKKLLAILDLLADKAGKMLEGLDPAQIVGVFDQIVGAVDMLNAAADSEPMQMLGTALKYAAIGAGILVGVFAVVTAALLAFLWIPVAVVGAIAALVAAIVGAAPDILSSATALGNHLVEGFVGGIKSGAASVIAAVTELASKAKGAMALGLDSHSPSRVFMKLGRFTGEGMALGIDQSAPLVERSVTAMVPPSSTGAPTAAPAGRGPMMINVGGITVTVSGAGDAKAVGHEVTRQIAEFFESIGLELGTTGPGAA